ncbi:MAG: FapA family protein [candidate division Zixibacteria bacterium]|nr:FapA family protein [candidate division Zixibacteria bacterium]MDH3936530.1 FapA family protein [candidate division Zixibacteria bacterium]MDH4033955.1 FapA family protein [candidate division Zixibacteria bacterium]
MSASQAQSTATRRRIRVTITKDSMKVVIVISRPESEEPNITVEEVRNALTQAGVVYGIDEDVISESVTMAEYEKPIEVAKGQPPVKGSDSEFETFFQTENRFQPQEDEEGRIDYRDMKYIQNTHKGDVLIRRKPPTDGVNGKGVDGREIVAPRGRNIPFNNGENTKVSDDGLELISTVDGAIVYSRGRVSVKDVMVINNVDFNVGNIDAVGSLRVSGKINTGFSVNVGGDLEVSGNVDDAKIHVKGNILVRGGFLGAGEGEMHADGDITVKYAVGQKLSAGGSIIVGGELLNCHVTAKDSVVVKGRKGKIVGGEINAGKKIEAAVIGSDAGTVTSLTVAFDAEAMRLFHEARHEISRLKADDERVKENLVQLYKLQMAGKLNDQQKAGLAKLEEFKNSVPDALATVEKRKAEVEERLKKLCDSKIIASEIMHAGVKAHVGVLVKEVDEDLLAVQLSQDGHRIIEEKYKKS